MAEHFFQSGFRYYDTNFYPDFLKHPPLYPFTYALSLKMLPFVDWINLYKAPMIVSNLAMGVMMFTLAGKGMKGLLASSLLLLHPVYVLYSVSTISVDAVMAVLLFAGVYLLRVRRSRLGAVFLGLAPMVRQYAVLAVIPVLLTVYKQRNLRGLVQVSAITALSSFFVSLPFTIYSSNFINWVFIRPWLLRDYFGFTDETLTGIWSITRNILMLTGRDLSQLPFSWMVVGLLLTFFLFSLLLVLTNKCRDPFGAAILGLAVFILAFPSVSSWALIPIIPFVIASFFLSTTNRVLLFAAILAPIFYRINTALFIYGMLDSSLGLILGDIAVSLTLVALFLHYALKGGQTVG